MILLLDGKKIFDGEISAEEYERYHDDASYLGEDGSIGYLGQKIRVYVIRRENGDDVYIQLTGDSAGGELNILQKEAFKQTLSEHREKAVVTELTALGIDAMRLSAKGFGSQNPVVDNTTPQGRAKNRRVELVKQ